MSFNYIRQLPYVNYTAVGINFNSILKVENSGNLLIDKFLMPGPWKTKEHQLQALGLSFIYSVPDAKLILKCDPGKVELSKENREIEGVVIKANYHSDLVTGEKVAEAKSKLDKFSQRYAHFQTITGILFK